VPGEKLAEKLVRLLRRGASFAEVARRYSMDPQTRFRGGEVGWVLAFTVPGEVLTVVEHAAPGGVADPVRSAGKWQVYKVFARRPSRVLPFAEVAGPIRRELTRRQRAAALDDWLARARERATIEILP
jgi:parvulin-like peptidyl-prolyl isomerase